MAGEITVINQLAPKNAGDFPVASDEHLLGGWRLVADITARDAITTERRVEGMHVFVVSERKAYSLDGGVDNADWRDMSTVVIPTTFAAEVGSVDAGFSDTTRFGLNASVGGNFATAYGDTAIASEASAVAYGPDSQATQASAMGMGRGARAFGFFAIAHGRNANASGTSAAAWGRNTLATHDRAEAHGDGAETTTDDTHTFGEVGGPGTTRKDVQVSGDARVSGHSVNGEEQILGQASVLLSDLSVSATASGIIPAGALLKGVALRVTTAITGATSFDVGDGADVDRWGAGIAIALGTTADNRDWTVGTVEVFPVAQDIVLTPVGGAFTGGAVRLVAYFETFTAPTS